MDISNHGSSFAKYAANKEFDVTGNSYSKNGELSPLGMKQMYELGQNFKTEYIDKQPFLSSRFDSNSVFLQSISDQSSLMSAYAFILGAYPDSVSYLNLNMPNALDHQKLVRKTLGLSETPRTSGTSPVSIKVEEGFMFWSDASRQCPEIYSKAQSHLKEAESALNNEYKNKLYPELAKTFKKSQNNFNFETTHKYLDDYFVAKNQGLSYPKFGTATNKLIEEYERDYYYEGVMGGNEIPRVVATPLLNYLLVNTFVKGESAKGKLSDKDVADLKHSHFFADEIGFSAFLKAIGYSQGQSPQPGQNIRFELFNSNKQQYVRATLDGRPMNFAESKQGIFELDTFLKTIYPMMYFGSIDNVCSGKEDISLNVYPKCQNFDDYLMMYLTNFKKIDHKIVQKCHLTEKVVPHAVRRPVVDIIAPPPPPPQKCPIRTEVIERAFPVIEEKVVVHEVERLVTEKPTHIHHIVIETPEKPAVLPPSFIEEGPSSGFPWWIWLLPLLCCIPLLALLCCIKRKKPAVARPKQPMAPVIAKPLGKPREKEIMAVKTEERHSPERKFVIERKAIDEGEEIEMEITRELQKSRVIREAHESRAVSHGRHTAAEIAAESNMSRGSGGGRKRRIKTIKKFGQVIGREEQILDEDGNVIKSERIGMDENEAASDHRMMTSSYHGNVIVGSDNQYMREGDGTEHHFKQTYEREGGYDEGGSGTMGAEIRSRRGYSSGRHLEGSSNVRSGGLDVDYDDELGSA